MRTAVIFIIFVLLLQLVSYTKSGRMKKIYVKWKGVSKGKNIIHKSFFLSYLYYFHSVLVELTPARKVETS